MSPKALWASWLVAWELVVLKVAAEPFEGVLNSTIPPRLILRPRF